MGTLTSRALALLLTILGLAAVATGVALIYLPAGIIAAGIALGIAGVFLVDVDGEQ